MTDGLSPLNRRQVLGAMGGFAATASYFGGTSALSSATTEAGGKKLVLIVLRGGMDGLHLVPPYGEPSYAAARGAIAIAPPGGEGGALKLDGVFGLHPALPKLHDLYTSKEALIVQAIAPPYALRSHFSAQDILENGTTRRSSEGGWLARALKGSGQSGEPPRGIHALSFGSALTPLTLQGTDAAAAWSPSDPNMRARTKRAIGAALARDPVLNASFSHVASLDALSPIAPDLFRGDTPQEWGALAHAAGRLLTAPGGPDVAVIDLYGWDSHAYMGGADGNWSLIAKEFDAALAALKSGLGSSWGQTVALAVTEFGRTVDVNGTGGTDHGVGGVALVLGGGIAGGRIVGDWLGLAPKDRYEGRDVRATSDMRALFKGVLRDHLGVGEGSLNANVFPDSAKVAPFEGLFRA